MPDKDYDTISDRGAIEYLSSFIQDMQDMVDKSNPRDFQIRIFKERVAFLSKVLELAKKSLRAEALSQEHVEALETVEFWLSSIPADVCGPLNTLTDASADEVRFIVIELLDQTKEVLSK